MKPNNLGGWISSTYDTPRNEIPSQRFLYHRYLRVIDDSYNIPRQYGADSRGFLTFDLAEQHLPSS